METGNTYSGGGRGSLNGHSVVSLYARHLCLSKFGQVVLIDRYDLHTPTRTVSRQNGVRLLDQTACTNELHSLCSIDHSARGATPSTSASRRFVHRHCGGVLPHVE